MAQVEGKIVTQSGPTAEHLPALGASQTWQHLVLSGVHTAPKIILRYEICCLRSPKSSPWCSFAIMEVESSNDLPFAFDKMFT